MASRQLFYRYPNSYAGDKIDILPRPSVNNNKCIKLLSGAHEGKERITYVECSGDIKK